jgi:hypothetical protein
VDKLNQKFTSNGLADSLRPGARVDNQFSVEQESLTESENEDEVVLSDSQCVMAGGCSSSSSSSPVARNSTSAISIGRDPRFSTTISAASVGQKGGVFQKGHASLMDTEAKLALIRAEHKKRTQSELLKKEKQAHRAEVLVKRQDQ